MDQFPSWELTVDLADPEAVQPELTRLTAAVERECPVGKYFGVSGIGEGIVWRSLDGRYAFKVKGDEHSSSNNAQPAAVSPEQLANVAKFVEFAVTENRLRQGLEHFRPANKQDIGKFIKWVITDVIKEESDTMAASQLTQAEVNKAITNAARKWFLNTVA